jgi:SAM-dependent methyltransferase
MEWWERFFDEETGEVMFTEQAWQRAEELCDSLVKLLEIEPGAKILDLACGPGRFALPLAKRGFRVLGLDISAVYLKQAKAKAKEQGLSVELVQGDMRAIPFDGKFDAVINLFTSFGFFEREEDHLRVLREVHKSLKPGGRFLLEIANREWLIRHFQAHDWHESPGFISLEERKFMPERDRLEARWIKLYPDGRRKEYPISLRLFTLHELIGLFSQAGLKVLSCYGNLEGEPWGFDKNRSVVVAER